MVDVCCFGNMLEDGSFDDNFVLETLRHEPGQVERGVDADRGESSSRIESRWNLILGKRAELESLRLVQ